MRLEGKSSPRGEREKDSRRDRIRAVDSRRRRAPLRLDATADLSVNGSRIEEKGGQGEGDGEKMSENGS